MRPPPREEGRIINDYYIKPELKTYIKTNTKAMKKALGGDANTARWL